MVILATELAVASAPATSAADGFEKGIRCAYVGPGAMLAPEVHVSGVPGTPYAFHTIEFTDSEPELPSNFSATVDWGDGTTSPASVEGEIGCYRVSAPSHIYLTPGTYSLSYIVHDAHTGLEHSIGGSVLDVVSALPSPMPSVPPRVVNAKVGVSWSGVVGEFDFQSLNNLQTAEGFTPNYTASIEWGDGQISPGIISEPIFREQLAVSGSHTYTRPLSSVIKVSISGGIETATWTTASALVPEVSRPFRFIRRPIFAIIPSVRGDDGYEIIFRLNQPLPQTKSHRIEASLASNGVTSHIAAFGSHPACYIARGNAFAERSRHLGQRYSIVLTLQGAADMMTHGQAIARKYANLLGMRDSASQQLGC
jgi:hypothetical protein